MNADVMWWFDHLWGLAVLAGGWFMHSLWDAMKELRTDLHALETNLPQNYVSKADLQPVLARLDATLTRIEARLDDKADKH